MANYNLAIELGSSNTVIYSSGVGIVLKEPSVIAIQTLNNKQVVNSVGVAAKNLIGKTNNSLEIVSPISEGEIANFNLCKLMLKEFLLKIAPSGLFKQRNKVVFLIPCGLSNFEKKKFFQLAYSLNINTVGLIPSCVCGLIGMEVEENNPNSHMLINMGGGCTDIAIVNNNHIIRGATINIGGANIDYNIGEYLKEKHNMMFGTNTLEEIKNQAGSMLVNDISSIVCYGTDIASQERKQVRILSQDIFEVLKSAVNNICDAAEAILNMCSTEVLKDISKFGIYICGGLSNLTGIEKYISAKLKLPVYKDADADSSVIRGAGNLLNNPMLLNKLLIK